MIQLFVATALRELSPRLASWLVFEPMFHCGNDWRRLPFRLIEQSNLLSEARRQSMAYLQIYAQLFADFLTDCLIATVVDIDWVAHDGTLVPLIPRKGLLDSSPFPCGESETAAFGYPSLALAF